MVVQSAALLNRIEMGAELMADQLTPRQVFCAPLLSALLFGGGSAGIADIYAHIRDIVTLNARDWESNPLERRLARWHTSLAMAISDFVRVGVIREAGHAKWSITEKGMAAAREFQLTNADGVLIERAVLRKKIDSFAVEFEKMYIVLRRPGQAAAANREAELAAEQAANVASAKEPAAKETAHAAPAKSSRENGRASSNGSSAKESSSASASSGAAAAAAGSGERVQWEDLVNE